MKLNENIVSLRKAKNITQEELATAVGVTNQSVSKWESGQCCPDIALLPALADYFEVSIDELMGYEARKNNKPDQAVLLSDSDHFANYISAALNILRESGKISAPMLQRKLCIGYGKATFIINKLYEQRYINLNQNGMYTPTVKAFDEPL